MRLEDQVCSLELAKKLKELGVKQESCWYWGEDFRLYTYSKNRQAVIEMTNGKLFKKDGLISAFTVAELGILMGMACETRCCAEDRGNPAEWEAKTMYDPNALFHEKTEADARAKMLIHLIEKDIVSGLKAEGREVEG